MKFLIVALMAATAGYAAGIAAESSTRENVVASVDGCAQLQQSAADRLKAHVQKN